MIKELIGLVVTYNPCIDTLLLNINRICKNLKQVIIVDNGSSNIVEIEEILSSNKMICLISNEENKGIATALNQGFSKAKSLGYRYLISFDQDSCPLDNMIYELWKCFEANEKKLRIGMLGPKYIESTVIAKKIIENRRLLKRDVIITSGCICNIDTILRIGGFLDKLFIDYVDFEMCLRLKLNGYSNFILNNAFLNHRLGNSVVKRFLWFKLIVTNHSSERRFFLFRNKVYVWRWYFLKNFLWVIRDILSSLKTILLILLYENKKIENLKTIYNGVKSAKYL